MKYSIGFRASIVRKTQDGSDKSITLVSKETGVSAATITRWIQAFKAGTLNLDGCDAITPSQQNPGEMLAACRTFYKKEYPLLGKPYRIPACV